MFEVRRCFSAKLANYHVLIDDHCTGRISAEHDAVGDLLNLCIKIASIRRRSEPHWLQCFYLREASVRTEFDLSTAWHELLSINFCTLVYQLEQIVEYTDSFRRAEQQIAAGIEGVMENRHSPPLQLRPEVDQDITTTDQIESRKRGISSDILPCKCADVAHEAIDLIRAVELLEETLQPFGRNIFLNCARINTQPRPLDG